MGFEDMMWIELDQDWVQRWTLVLEALKVMIQRKQGHAVSTPLYSDKTIFQPTATVKWHAA